MSVAAGAWDEATSVRLRWLASAVQVTPDDDAEIRTPAGVVRDVRLWLESLTGDVAQGPAGPRTMYGALQADLAIAHHALVVSPFIASIEDAKGRDALWAVGKEIEAVQSLLDAGSVCELRDAWRTRDGELRRLTIE